MHEEFQYKVLTGLGKIEGALEGVNERLDALNGSVARHEKRLNEMALDDAKQAGRDEISNTWIDRLSPVVKVILGIGAVLALQNARPIADAALKVIGAK